MLSIFRKKPLPTSLEQQLSVLAGCGVSLSAEATVDDLFMFHSREEHEATPYKELIPTLDFDMERGSYAPICNRLWMCDYERVEDHGAYSDVLVRLQQMSEDCLPISNVIDFVDIEAGKAWVEFDLAGTRIHWDAEVGNDWLDPNIVVRFDDLLTSNKTPFRIYSNHTDFGQSAFFACLTPAEFIKFQKLAAFKLREIDKQA